MAKPSTPQESEEEEAYEVESIIRHRNRKGKGLEYYVSWVSYGPEHNLWIGEEDASGSTELIKEYWKKTDGKKTKSKDTPPAARRKSDQATTLKRSTSGSKKRSISATTFERKKKSLPTPAVDSDEEIAGQLQSSTKAKAQKAKAAAGSSAMKRKRTATSISASSASEAEDEDDAPKKSARARKASKAAETNGRKAVKAASDADDEDDAKEDDNMSSVTEGEIIKEFKNSKKTVSNIDDFVKSVETVEKDDENGLGLRFYVIFKDGRRCWMGAENAYNLCPDHILHWFEDKLVFKGQSQKKNHADE